MLNRTFEANKTEEIQKTVNALEQLAFPYVIRATVVNGRYEYRVIVGEEEQPERTEPVYPVPAVKKREMGSVHRRTREEKELHNKAISEYLRNKRGSVTCEQLHKELSVLGHEWKPQSTTSIIQLAMEADANIIRTGHGMYAYNHWPRVSE
jgi:hypothetical protein